MYQRFLLTASAMCIASVAMLLGPDSAFAQKDRENKGGRGGGRSSGANVSRGESSRGSASQNRGNATTNRGNTSRSSDANVSRGQASRGEDSNVSRSRDTGAPRAQSPRKEPTPAPSIAGPNVTPPNVTTREGRSDRTTVNKPVIPNDAGKAGVTTSRDADRNRPSAVARPDRNTNRDVDRNRPGDVNRPDRDANRRDDWTNWNRNRNTTDWNRNDWDRNRGDWTRNDWDRNRGDWNRNDWNRNWNNWNNWNRNFASRNWGPYSTPSYWRNYYRSGYYGSPFFGFGGGGYYPGYGYPGYGYGGYYGTGGWLPGIGIGLGLGRLFGGGYYGGGYGYPGYYGGNYYTTYNTAPDTVVTEAEPAVTGDYLDAARETFMSGDYARAQRLAHHAIVDEPDNAKGHELMSLAFFAQGNYAAAAEAAHAAVSLGELADWPTLYRYYNDRNKYEQHFNALKQFVNEHSNAPEGRFLLGLHHLMMGHKDSARNELAQYLKLVDNQDPIGAKLYGEAGGDVNALPKPSAPAPQPPAAADVDGTR